ncbi:MAG: SMC family ATPase, partial [Bacteroidota bacterium]
AQIAERQQQIQTIQQLGRAAKCPTCLQPLITSYDKTLRHLQAAIDEYESKTLNEQREILKDLKEQQVNNQQTMEMNAQRFHQTQARLTALQEKAQLRTQEEVKLKKGQQYLKNTQAEIQALGTIHFDQAQYQALVEAIAQFEPIFLHYHSVQDDLAKLPQIIDQLQQLATRIQTGKNKIKTQQEALTQLGFSEEAYAQAKTQQNQLETEKDALAKQVQTLEAAHQQLLHELQQQELQLANDQKIQKAIEAKQQEMETLDQLDGLFKTFKTYILDRVKPTITHHAGELFQRITKGRYESIQIDDHFEFHIFENGVAYPIQRFSGGEIDLANLCLRIGISKAIAELSGHQKTLSFLGFDEIFGSQDEERRFEILAALDLLKEQYRQIYIITHVDAVKEHFPHILQVQKTSAGSRAQWL